MTKTEDFLSLVMVSALNNENVVSIDFEDQSMFAIDASGPISGQIVFQWFWTSETLEWRSLNGFNQFVDSADLLPIGVKPINIVVPCQFCPGQNHSATRSCW